ncbi:DUF6134 family protein [Ferrovibrio terrae]|uniref:DUF6134 family protein n=1 Tax=Ferrovibrio terrae TaxID=2594003 RepID=UPI003137D192
MTTTLPFSPRYVLIAVLTLFVGSQAFAAPPNGGQLSFTITRDGSEVGSHEMLFRRTADDLQIDIATKVLVKVAFIPVYRFEHEGHEVWHGDRLTRLWSKTNDDGTSHALNVTAAGADLAVLADGKPVVDRPLRIPASLWHEGILRQSAILNTLDGSSMAIAVSDLGSESVTAAGRPVPARHYAITGDLQRELWYDEHNVLVKVRFKAKDGSDIEYIRR